MRTYPSHPGTRQLGDQITAIRPKLVRPASRRARRDHAEIDASDRTGSRGDKGDVVQAVPALQVHNGGQPHQQGPQEVELAWKERRLVVPTMGTERARRTIAPLQ